MVDSFMLKYKAVIFGWSGTLIDFGAFASVDVLSEAFRSFGISITIDEVRQSMGLLKHKHIEHILSLSHVADQWADLYGARPTQHDIKRVYEVYVPMQERTISQHAMLVPSAISVLHELRHAGLHVATTSEFNRSIMGHILPKVSEQGFTPDNLVCADDLVQSRPGPLGIYKSMVDLGIYPPSAMIKVDSTSAGISEGAAAGCLTIGITKSGNYIGKSQQELAEMPDEELSVLSQNAARKLKLAGAHYVIDTISQLPNVLKNKALHFSKAS